MDSIIVTFTDLEHSFTYDLEIPLKVTLDKLKDDIIDTLYNYDNNIHILADQAVFLCSRTGKSIDPYATMYTAGVWNGDYITIVEV